MARPLDPTPPRRPVGRPERLLLWGVLAAVGGALAIIVFGIPRGFDWTDEAWTISLSLTQRVSDTEPWAFQFLLHPLVTAIGANVVVLRVFRLALYAILGVVAALVVVRLAALRGHTLGTTARILVFATAQIGTILAWSWPPRAFAYNELTSFLVQVVALLIALLVMSGSPRPVGPLTERRVVLLWGIIGVAIGLLFFTKFLASFILFPIAVVGILISTRGRRPSSLVALVAAMIAAIGLPWALGLPLPSYARSVVANLLDENLRAANVHSHDILLSYALDLGSAGLILAGPAVLLFVAALLVTGAIPKSGSAAGATRVVGALLTGLLGVLALAYVIQGASGAYKTGRLALTLLVVGIIVLIFLPLALRLRRSSSPLTPPESAQPGGFSDWRAVLALLLLAGAPLISSFGTNNALTAHVGFGATVWAAGFGMATAMLFETLSGLDRPRLRLWPLSLVAVAALLGGIVAVAEARNPYRSASFLANNTPLVDPGPFAGLSVTPDEHELIAWLRREAVALDAHDTPTISLASPGALLAFNNSDFASSFTAAWWPASYWTIATACEDGAPEDLIVLQPSSSPLGSPDGDILATTLADSCGLDFPGAFDAVASRDATEPSRAFTIWRLKAGAR